jgi:hypothetical protein
MEQRLTIRLGGMLALSIAVVAALVPRSKSKPRGPRPSAPCPRRCRRGRGPRRRSRRSRHPRRLTRNVRLSWVPARGRTPLVGRTFQRMLKPQRLGPSSPRAATGSPNLRQASIQASTASAISWIACSGVSPTAEHPGGSGTTATQASSSSLQNTSTRYFTGLVHTCRSSAPAAVPDRPGSCRRGSEN